MIDTKGDFLAKRLILGNSQVGKSCILNQFTEGSFSETTPPTLGIDYKITNLTVEKTTVKLQIWDTAGQERFKSITENFYKGAQGILLVFDLCDIDSFSNIRVWVKNILEKAGQTVTICLIGNKLDLLEKCMADPELAQKCVPKEAIDQLINEYNFHYMTSSAKKNINIKEAFTYLASELIKKNADLIKENKGKSIKSSQKEPEEKKDGCC